MGRSSNDQRSDALNPTSQDYKDSQDNRSNQLNPEHDAYESSRSGAQGGEQQQQGQDED